MEDSRVEFLLQLFDLPRSVRTFKGQTSNYLSLKLSSAIEPKTQKTKEKKSKEPPTIFSLTLLFELWKLSQEFPAEKCFENLNGKIQVELKKELKDFCKEFSNEKSATKTDHVKLFRCNSQIFCVFLDLLNFFCVHLQKEKKLFTIDVWNCFTVFKQFLPVCNFEGSFYEKFVNCFSVFLLGFPQQKNVFEFCIENLEAQVKGTQGFFEMECPKVADFFMDLLKNLLGNFSETMIDFEKAVERLLKIFNVFFEKKGHENFKINSVLFRKTIKNLLKFGLLNDYLSKIILPEICKSFTKNLQLILSKNPDSILEFSKVFILIEKTKKNENSMCFSKDFPFSFVLTLQSTFNGFFRKRFDFIKDKEQKTTLEIQKNCLHFSDFSDLFIANKVFCTTLKLVTMNVRNLNERQVQSLVNLFCFSSHNSSKLPKKTRRMIASFLKEMYERSGNQTICLAIEQYDELLKVDEVSRKESFQFDLNRNSSVISIENEQEAIGIPKKLKRNGSFFSYEQEPAKPILAKTLSQQNSKRHSMEENHENPFTTLEGNEKGKEKTTERKDPTQLPKEEDEEIEVVFKQN